MKKNKMMRLASALMVATLLSTSVISGTFAKYVTTNSTADSARVAKWGITVSTSGNLFGTDYAKHTGNDADDKITASSTNVSSANGNVVAPGTKNFEGTFISISGTPEVEYNVSAQSVGDIKDIFLAEGEYGVMVKATGLNAATSLNGYYLKNGENEYVLQSTGYYESGDYYKLHDYINVTADYYPINWTVTHAGKATEITNNKDLKVIVPAMVAGIDDGTHLAKESAAASYQLTWEWPFEDGKNGEDTILGNLMAGNTTTTEVVKKLDSGNYKAVEAASYCVEVAYGIQVTVEQVN